MPVEVKMPKLGLTMTEGTVTQWLVAQGTKVEKGSPLFVMETDKVTLEIEAPVSGVLHQILVPAGTMVPVLQAIALIAGPGEELGPAVEPAPSAGPAETRVVQTKEAGQAAEAAPLRASPKARSMARAGGLDLAQVEGRGPGGRVVAEDVARVLAQQAAMPSAVASASQETRVRATPRAQRLAEEAGLDLATMVGTGPGGRVAAEDVQRAMAARRAALSATSGREGEVEVLPLAGVRAVVAQRMAESAHTTAPVTLTSQADATELIRIREALSEEWHQTVGFAPGYNDLLLVLLSRTLAEYPYMNARLIGNEIHLVADVNIGLAVDTERGLVVPVLPRIQNKTLDEIACLSRELVDRARAGRLLPDDLCGGTFTLSNMGMFDVEAFTPIINLPECAILGAGRIAPRPAVVDGVLCVRPMMTLSLTVDHRAVDGAPAARFLTRLKQLVESPYPALLPPRKGVQHCGAN
jgi:pyruvate dehydrogenase E2 component (dihydrolipoamide acetyltransferase)